MVLQAAIDESGNAPDQHTFVLGGFLATAEQWAAFAVEWEAELNRDPRIEYFKFKEASNLKDQFHGWSEQACDERVERLALIIRKHVTARFHASIQHDHFQEFVRRVPVPSRRLLSDHPYILVLSRMLTTVASLMADLDLKEDCDFYFDSQNGVDAEVIRMWPAAQSMIGTLPARIKGSPAPAFGVPTFRDEKKFLPLQAADMMAGAAREALMTGQTLAAVQSIEDIPARIYHFSEAEVRRVGQMIVDYVSTQPGQKFGYDRNTARRQRKKQRRDERRDG